jgi:uncharacterized OsmC-like protein
MSDLAHRFTVRVTADGARPTAKVHVRQYGFEVGDPVSFDVEHPHITAVEYLLGAIAADVAGTVRVLGRKRRIEIDDIEVLVNAELHDPLVYLRVVGRSGLAGIAQINAKVYISSFAEERELRRLWEEVLAACPVVSTLEHSVRLGLAYQHVS